MPTVPLTPMAVSRAAQAVCADLLSKSDDPVFRDVDVPTPWHINCGLCEEFAERVAARFSDDNECALSVIWLHETLIYDDDGPTGFDPDILATFGMALPEGYDENDLFEIVSESAHAVLVYYSRQYGVRFYDAQALQGVSSYFDLPLMQDAVGMLDDPEVRRWKHSPEATDCDKLEEAVAAYFRQRMEVRVADYQARSIPKMAECLTSEPA